MNVTPAATAAALAARVRAEGVMVMPGLLDPAVRGPRRARWARCMTRASRKSTAAKGRLLADRLPSQTGEVAAHPPQFGGEVVLVRRGAGSTRGPCGEVAAGDVADVGGGR